VAYLNGEYEQVCNELMALGEQVRQEPVYFDACSVAEEAMRRVRANAETLVSRLNAIGFKFYETPLRPPLPDARQRILEIEENFAQIPFVWRACCEIVGDIDFGGSHPEWKGDLTDLQIDGESVVEGFVDWGEYEDDNGDLILHVPISGVEGVGSYGTWVPNGAFDAPIDFDDVMIVYGASLLNYLRVNLLRCGGFLGYDFPYQEKAVIPHIDALTRDLIPF